MKEITDREMLYFVLNKKPKFYKSQTGSYVASYWQVEGVTSINSPIFNTRIECIKYFINEEIENDNSSL